MRSSPVVVIEEPFEARLGRLVDEYVTSMQAEFRALDEGGDGFEGLSAYLLDALERIRKRLGPARYPGIRASLEQALARQAESGEMDGHREWLAGVLKHYYDPMYEDQLRQREHLISFRGDYAACRDYLLQAE